MSKRFGVLSQMVMAVRPKLRSPYLFGLHQCSYARVWSEQERRLFEEIGRRLNDALGQLWATLGGALVALGAAQALAAWWVRQGRPEGFVMARLVGWALIVASALMAGPGGQVSSLLTEGARGVAILGLAVWAAPRGRSSA